MRTVYIDDDCKCHLSNDGNYTAVETDVFDEHCDEFIEGCCFVPEGKERIREDGEVFEGESFFPWKDSTELEEPQRAYEYQLLQDRTETLADAENALAIMLGGETT